MLTYVRVPCRRSVMFWLSSPNPEGSRVPFSAIVETPSIPLNNTHNTSRYNPLYTPLEGVKTVVHIGYIRNKDQTIPLIPSNEAAMYGVHILRLLRLYTTQPSVVKQLLSVPLSKDFALKPEPQTSATAERRVKALWGCKTLIAKAQGTSAVFTR